MVFGIGNTQIQIQIQIHKYKYTNTSSMVSGSLVFRVSGRERTSKPDMRHKLMITSMCLMMKLMRITMMNLPKVRKGMRAGEEGTRRSPSRRT